MRATNSRRGDGALLLLSLVAAWTAAGGAKAQMLDQIQAPPTAGVGTEPGVTVLSRLRPEYDYPGVRLGTVMLRPEIASSTGYDDNVLGTTTKRGSVVQRTQLDLQAVTGWAKNGLQAGLQVDDVRFLDQPRQSYTNLNATLGGTFALGRDTLAATYTHLNLAQTPRDLNTPQLDAAIPYRIDTLNLRYDAMFNRLQLSPAVQVSNYSFDNGTVAGQPYRQAYRNRVVVTPELTASYEAATQRSVVGVVRNAVATYQNRLPGQPSRDYNDTAALAGIDFQTTGPWRMRVLAGYEVRTFGSNSFKTIQSPIAEARVIWTLTGLTTLTATVARQIADSADETTAGLTSTVVKLAVDHELQRNVLLHGQGSVAVASFGQGGGTQTLYDLTGSATWLLNRNARLGFSYTFTARNGGAAGLFGSSGSASGVQRIGGNYTENRALLQLRLGL